MNAITTTGRAGISSLAPQTFGEAVEFSKMLSRSGMVPKDYNGKPEAIMVALQWGAEVGLGPLQALNGISVINGKPALWGDAALALVRGHPACAGIREGVEGEGDAMLGFCEVTRRGEPPQRRTFSVADARKAGLWGKAGPWQQYPQRMLQMRARGFAIRDVFPDALRGVITVEEAQDIPAEPRFVQNTAPADPPARPLAAAIAEAQEKWPVIAPSGATHMVPPGRWQAAIGKALGGLEDAAALQGWREAMRPILLDLADREPEAVNGASSAILARLAELAPAMDAEAEPADADADDSWPGPKA